MPTIPLVLGQAIPDHTGVVLMARVRNFAGVLITQASVQSITLVVTDLTLEKAVPGSGFISSTPLVVANTVFDSIQFDYLWSKDGPQNPAPPIPFGDSGYGYNVRTLVPSSSFAATGHRFRCDLLFVPVGVPARTQDFVIAFEFPTFAVYA